MELTDQQATSILVEGLARGLFEPAVPTEESDRIKDATALVEACEKANKAGNKSENVETILFMSQVNSDTTQIKGQTSIPVVVPANSAGNEEVQVRMGEEAITDSVPIEEPMMHNGLNLAELSDGILDQLIVGLDQYPQTDEVEVDRKAYTAEKERRNNGSGKGLEEDSSAQVAPETPEKAGEAAPEIATASGQGGAETSRGQPSERSSDNGVEGENSGQEVDASAFARAQTPETSGKEKPSKAKPQEKDGERAELEGQLTYDMLKAHGVDLLAASKTPINELRYIVENPSGPCSATDSEEISPKEEEKVAIIESQVVGVTNPKLDNALGGITPVKSVQQKVVTKADLNLGVTDDEEPSRTGISKDRETLESLLTGPCLKVYGRGRKEVPGIGDNELRLMVLNSSAKASDAEIEKAQMMDGKAIIVNQIDEPQDNQYDAEQVIGADRSIAESASEAINTTTVRLTGELASQDRFAPGENPTTNVTLPSGQVAKVFTKSSDKLPTIVNIDEKEIDVAKPLTGQARAMEIIEREGFPTPVDLEGVIPSFPQDISKSSDDELFSYHAIYHSCESRANWILLQHEENQSDIEKLRRVREIDVANSIPLLSPEDGKRITNEFRDAKVAADSLVIQYYEEEHEKKKTVKRLKVLRDNYRSDTAACSRQWSMRSGELKDAPK